MDLKDEFENLAEKLKRQRDELNLRMHLAGMEAKQEWEHSEKKWSEFKQRFEDIRDETKDVSEEFAAATIIIGEELSKAYKRIVERLKD